MISVKSNIADVLARMDSYKKDVVEKAVPRALNRCGEMARTAASREMRAAGYNFTASEIKRAMSLIRASRGKLVTTIKVKRKTKSLMQFSPKEGKTGVTVKVFGQPKLIKGAFIAQRQNGVSGVFVEDKTAGKIVLRFQKEYKRGSRGGWHEFPARKLYGPSVGGSYSTDRIQQIMELFIRSTFEQRLTHELKYLSR